MRRSGVVTSILVLGLLVGVVAPIASAQQSTPAAETTPVNASTSTTQYIDESGNQTVRPDDPAEDTIGWENGRWHNESISVDQSDGLTDQELEAYVNRAMARVEYIRKQEFREAVPVTVMTRQEYASQSNSTATSKSDSNWNNQVWEALFITGEQTNITKALAATYSASVGGFYSPTKDEITLILDSEDSNRMLDNATLHHELAHALQDQQWNLTKSKYTGDTQDRDLAIRGLVEGEANYIERRYSQRCANGAWDCVETPKTGGGGGSSSINYGILLTIFHPYSDGPVYIDWLKSQNGWEAVDANWQHPPNSTEQIIHTTRESPASIAFEDTAENGWKPFTSNGTIKYDTVGEASIFSMFWYQAREYQIETMRVRQILDTNSEFDVYNYSHRFSDGWAGDKLVPYRRTGSGDSQFGYVWTTEWDSPEEAKEFMTGYRTVLSGHEAEQISENTWRIQTGEYADVFRVINSGARVIIINGPSVEAVNDLKPNYTESPTTEPETNSPTATPTSDPAEMNSSSSSTTTSADDTATPSETQTSSPGFTFGPALAAIAILALRRLR